MNIIICQKTFFYFARQENSSCSRIYVPMKPSAFVVCCKVLIQKMHLPYVFFKAILTCVLNVTNRYIVQ